MTASTALKTVSKSRFKGRAYKPYKSTIAGLNFVRVWRCDSCGEIYRKKTAQCHCGNVAITFFHSRAEAGRYATLIFMQGQGTISNLKKQVRFPLYTVNPDGLKEKVCDYIADFVYDQDGARIVEDVKGGLTDTAKLKAKWFKTQHGQEILYTKGSA